VQETDGLLGTQARAVTRILLGGGKSLFPARCQLPGREARHKKHRSVSRAAAGKRPGWGAVLAKNALLMRAARYVG
jgi:hypothetical protein